MSGTGPIDRQTNDVAFHRVAYDVAAMAGAIRAADGLPDPFATDLETAGHHAVVTL